MQLVRTRGQAEHIRIRARIMKGLLRFGVCLGAILMLVSTMQAQTTAQLSGTVTDNTGAVIPGAQVTLTNEASKDSRVVTTNDNGIFTFPALLPETYTLKVTAKSFEGKSFSGIELHGSSRDAWSFRAEPRQ